MEELLSNISNKFGLSKEQSYQAFRMVLNFLKDKLPEPAGSQINTMLMKGDGQDNPASSIKDLGSKFTTK